MKNGCSGYCSSKFSGGQNAVVWGSFSEFQHGRMQVLYLVGIRENQSPTSVCGQLSVKATCTDLLLTWQYHGLIHSCTLLDTIFMNLIVFNVIFLYPLLYNFWSSLM